eukprot:Skav210934  [mRNA]  locus=scaffold713:72460:78032:+ [translate_table: standard]
MLTFSHGILLVTPKVICYLKSDQAEFLESDRLKEEDVEVQEEGEEAPEKRRKELINKNKPLWLRPAEEVTHEEYAELYKFLSADWEDWGAMTPKHIKTGLQKNVFSMFKELSKGLKRDGFEVLYMTDPVDEYAVQFLKEWMDGDGSLLYDLAGLDSSDADAKWSEACEKCQERPWECCADIVQALNLGESEASEEIPTLGASRISEEAAASKVELSPAKAADGALLSCGRCVRVARPERGRRAMITFVDEAETTETT